MSGCVCSYRKRLNIFITLAGCVLRDVVLKVHRPDAHDEKLEARFQRMSTPMPPAVRVQPKGQTSLSSSTAQKGQYKFRKQCKCEIPLGGGCGRTPHPSKSRTSVELRIVQNEHDGQMRKFLSSTIAFSASPLTQFGTRCTCSGQAHEPKLRRIAISRDRARFVVTQQVLQLPVQRRIPPRSFRFDSEHSPREKHLTGGQSGSRATLASRVCVSLYCSFHSSSIRGSS